MIKEGKYRLKKRVRGCQEETDERRKKIKEEKKNNGWPRTRVSQKKIITTKIKQCFSIQRRKELSGKPKVSKRENVKRGQTPTEEKKEKKRVRIKSIAKKKNMRREIR